MVAFETAIKLRRQGVRVVTVCRPDSPLQNKLNAQSQFTISMQPGHKYFSPRAICISRRLIATGKFQAVLIQQMADLWHVVPALTGDDDTRLIAISHTLIGVSKKDLLHEAIYDRLDSVIALTEYHRRNLLEKLPLKPQVVTVIPNAVDAVKFNPSRRGEEFRKNLMKNQDGFLIGVVSRLDMNKGLLEAVGAAGELKKLGLPFHMAIAGQETAGETGARAALQSEIAKLGLQNEVTLTGHLSNVEVAMASFDVLLMPSPVETFGRIIIEAMASNTPVAAAAGGGVPDIIQNGMNGLLFEPLNIQQMGAALADLLRDPAKRERIALGGRQSVAKFYDEKVVDLKLFEQLEL